MTKYEVVQICRLIEVCARAFGELMARADPREAQAAQPMLTIPGQPAPPSPQELRADAEAMRQAAEAERQLIVSLVAQNFMAKPQAVVDEKVGGRLARLNGAAEGS